MGEVFFCFLFYTSCNHNHIKRLTETECDWFSDRFQNLSFTHVSIPLRWMNSFQDNSAAECHKQFTSQAAVWCNRYINMKISHLTLVCVLCVWEKKLFTELVVAKQLSKKLINKFWCETWNRIIHILLLYHVGKIYIFYTYPTCLVGKKKWWKSSYSIICYAGRWPAERWDAERELVKPCSGCSVAWSATFLCLCIILTYRHESHAMITTWWLTNVMQCQRNEHDTQFCVDHYSLSTRSAVLLLSIKCFTRYTSHWLVLIFFSVTIVLH